MDNTSREIFSRNSGIFSESEQLKLFHSVIGIAGVGGVGGLLAERLIRTGIGTLNINDPGTFELSNFNRQFGASLSSLNQNKAEVVYSQIKDINPKAKIVYNKTGIQTEIDSLNFINGCDLVIDEMDFGMFRQSIWLQRAARNQGKYYFFTSAIGFGALVVIFSPNGMTLEEFDNLPAGTDINTINNIYVPLERVIPVIPSYAPASTREALMEIYAKAKAIPTTSIGVGLASILAANEAINIILNKRHIPTAPEYIWVDLLDQQFMTGKIA